MKKYQQYIDGQWCDSSDGTVITTIDPSNEAPWAQVPGATEEDVNRAVAAAKKALYEGPWSSMTATQRGRLLRRLGDLIAEKSHHLGGIETTDSGKLAKETRAQTGYVSDYYYYFAGLADKIEGATLPIDKPDMHVFTTREPIGVVAAVVPWNAQMFLTATKLGPALAAGNTVVLKASEDAPAPMFEFAKIIEEAGFPAGVINVITGYGEPCGRALTGHPDVARVAFTGGPETASRVIQNTSRNFAVVSLELGGKSPIVVFDDADIDGAVNGIIAGNFGASGQSCVAGSRVIIQEGIYDEIIEKLTARASQIQIGDPLDDDTQMGPLATKAQIDRIVAAVEKSQQQGATLHHGGKRPAQFEKGYYYEPTILGCPDQNVETVQNEMFGPVLSALKFSDEAEGIAMANNTKFGLGAGVFTENLARAHRVSAAIHSGIVWVNTYRAISPIAPFGGFGHSGYGREAGIDALLDYTRTKTTWINTSSEPMANPFIMR
ncbi:MAG: aldehyde dehydrogenase family protein [Gammaproteobacteria bacterium]|nr:aldehyde dehydrogenase family protein [Gammaproteobacteria bacterium]